jgi:hypothetical protein
LDFDGDGYGVDGPAAACLGPDCDDSTLACGAACHPGATEVCDNYDNDCTGTVDDSLAGCRCANGAAFPVPEVCGNGIDDDCDTVVDDGCPQITPILLAGSSISSIATDSAGNVWIGGTDPGAAWYLPQGGALPEDIVGLRAYPIAVVATDANDAAWFGYWEAENCDNGVPDCGPTRINAARTTLTDYSTDYMSIDDNHVTAITPEPGTDVLYIGTGDDHGFYRESIDSIECDINTGAVPDGHVSRIVVGVGDPAPMWSVRLRTILRCQPQHALAGQCGDTCNQIPNPSSPNNADMIYDDRGTPAVDDDVLIHGDSEGVRTINPQTSAVITEWDATTGMVSENVTTLAMLRISPSEAYLLAGTGDGGVGVLNLITGAWAYYGSAQGLPSDNVTALAVDVAQRTVWIGTDAGLVSGSL